jgi:hypothetical protein
VCKLAGAHDKDQDLIEVKNIDRNFLSGALPEINGSCIVWKYAGFKWYLLSDRSSQRGAMLTKGANKSHRN